jgi:hypothetical protein
MTSSLTWTPTGNYLRASIESRSLSIAISPFVKLNALKFLLKECESTANLQIISCWNANSLLSGATDPEIFQYLNSVGAKLFVHPHIHLKLFVLSESRAFHTSSNITMKGLGLATNANVEIGCEVELGINDWTSIYQVLHESVRVDQQMYEQALEYITKNKDRNENAPPLKLAPSQDQEFSLNALPLYPSPQKLISDCQKLRSGNLGTEKKLIYALAHDCALFNIRKNMTKDDMESALRRNFQSSTFIQAIISLLKEHKSARFGLVTDWIHRNCSDKPIPYRSTIKDSVHTLYSWLDYFYDEVSWSIPGAHSMVIKWSGEN